MNKIKPLTAANISKGAYYLSDDCRCANGWLGYVFQDVQFGLSVRDEIYTEFLEFLNVPVCAISAWNDLLADKATIAEKLNGFLELKGALEHA